MVSVPQMLKDMICRSKIKIKNGDTTQWQRYHPGCGLATQVCCLRCQCRFQEGKVDGLNKKSRLRTGWEKNWGFICNYMKLAGNKWVRSLPSFWANYIAQKPQACVCQITLMHQKKVGYERCETPNNILSNIHLICGHGDNGQECFPGGRAYWGHQEHVKESSLQRTDPESIKIFSSRGWGPSQYLPNRIPLLLWSRDSFDTFRCGYPVHVCILCGQMENKKLVF